MLHRIGRILDEGQPCEEAGFWRRLSTIDYIYILTELLVDTVETEAVIEALGNQGVPTQYIRVRFCLENIMRHLEWEDLGVIVDGCSLHHLSFADDIVPITPNIDQAERRLSIFDGF
ncbi:hypothetical protein V3C99_008584 [Haemonchus contortus]|uniref:Reverse transcriptase domain-containing protein n=1 Tax=Haemonchus contortus TaxID=6289 RepID=A0A7I5EAV6_HAECO